MGEYIYYIPMSSPKQTDYQVAGDSMVCALVIASTEKS
ncbi:MAG: hypothetical protein IKB01_07340 [Lachnospiraceae bacterium]|nr:hypothetical protein [Lachnospiraceae bacterium]